MILVPSGLKVLDLERKKYFKIVRLQYYQALPPQNTYLIS